MFKQEFRTAPHSRVESASFSSRLGCDASSARAAAERPLPFGGWPVATHLPDPVDRAVEGRDDTDSSA